MTPKEKAKELYMKFFYEIECANSGINGADIDTYTKDCALIAVDEILDTTKEEYQVRYTNGEYSREIGFTYSEFWQEVKREIENI